jgi:hypothetical protein
VSYPRYEYQPPRFKDLPIRLVGTDTFKDRKRLIEHTFENRQGNFATVDQLHQVLSVVKDKPVDMDVFVKVVEDRAQQGSFLGLKDTFGRFINTKAYQDAKAHFTDIKTLGSEEIDTLLLPRLKDKTLPFSLKANELALCMEKYIPVQSQLENILKAIQDTPALVPIFAKSLLEQKGKFTEKTCETFHKSPKMRQALADAVLAGRRQGVNIVMEQIAYEKGGYPGQIRTAIDTARRQTDHISPHKLPVTWYQNAQHWFKDEAANTSFKEWLRKTFTVVKPEQIL